MIEIFNILIGITVLFFILLVFKQFLPKKKKDKFCVICASISLTWITLLVLYYIKLFDNLIILSILIGTSITGIYYLVESKVNKRMKVFRLPFILTLIFIGYNLINGFYKELNVWILLLILWLLFIFFYIYSGNKKINLFVNKLVECCKKW